MKKIITSSDITVVIQGPLYRGAPSGDGIMLTIESIKSVLPNSPIIVSTWTNENTKNLPSTINIILSEPPAPLIDTTGNINNVENQLNSTLAGLKKVTTPYALKLRADHLLNGTQLFYEPECVNPKVEHAYFFKKISITTLFLRDPLKVPFLFHISDLVHFGTTQDMLRFWSSTLSPTDSIQQVGRHASVRLFGNFAGQHLFKETPEQTLTRLWLAREGVAVDLDFPCTTSLRLFSLWEKVLTHNFEVVNYQSSGVNYPARFSGAFLGKKTILTRQSFAAMQRNPGSKKRYARLLLSKYITCWFIPRYWLATANVILSRLMPRLASRIRGVLRARMGLTHPDRR